MILQRISEPEVFPNIPLGFITVYAQIRKHLWCLGSDVLWSDVGCCHESLVTGFLYKITRSRSVAVWMECGHKRSLWTIITKGRTGSWQIRSATAKTASIRKTLLRVARRFKHWRERNEKAIIRMTGNQNAPHERPAIGDWFGYDRSWQTACYTWRSKTMIQVLADKIFIRRD